MMRDLRAPFAVFKNSGIGREKENITKNSQKQKIFILLICCRMRHDVMVSNDAINAAASFLIDFFACASKNS
jgi:hypothetical protein